MAQLGRIPMVGDRATVHSVILEVEHMQGRRIMQIALYAPDQEDEQPEVQL